MNPDAELIHAEQVVSEAAHELALRGETTESGIQFDSHGHVVTTKLAGSSGLGTASTVRTSGTAGTIGYSASSTATATSAKSEEAPVGVSIPVS